MIVSRVDLRGAFSVTTVAFSHAFQLPGGEECPPGIYEIETEEEPAAGARPSLLCAPTVLRLNQRQDDGTGLVQINLPWLHHALAVDRRRGLFADLVTLHQVS